MNVISHLAERAAQWYACSSRALGNLLCILGAIVSWIWEQQRFGIDELVIDITTGVKASSSRTDLLSICLFIQPLEEAVQGYVRYSRISVDLE
jgi:hypothetical protein